MAGLWLHARVHLGMRIIYSSTVSSHFGLRYSIPNVMSSYCHFFFFSFYHFLSSVLPPPHHPSFFVGSTAVISFFHLLSLSHFLLFFPQYHRDLEMSLSLSASQVQAVMLALSKPVCVCVCVCMKRCEEQLVSVGPRTILPLALHLRLFGDIGECLWLDTRTCF